MRADFLSTKLASALLQLELPKSSLHLNEYISLSACRALGRSGCHVIGKEGPARNARFFFKNLYYSPQAMTIDMFRSAIKAIANGFESPQAAERVLARCLRSVCAKYPEQLLSLVVSFSRVYDSVLQQPPPPPFHERAPIVAARGSPRSVVPISIPIDPEPATIAAAALMEDSAYESVSAYPISISSNNEAPVQTTPRHARCLRQATVLYADESPFDADSLERTLVPSRSSSAAAQGSYPSSPISVGQPHGVVVYGQVSQSLPTTEILKTTSFGGADHQSSQESVETESEYNAETDCHVCVLDYVDPRSLQSETNEQTNDENVYGCIYEGNHNSSLRPGTLPDANRTGFMLPSSTVTQSPQPVTSYDLYRADTIADIEDINPLPPLINSISPVTGVIGIDTSSAIHTKHPFTHYALDEPLRNTENWGPVDNVAALNSEDTPRETTAARNEQLLTPRHSTTTKPDRSGIVTRSSYTAKNEFATYCPSTVELTPIQPMPAVVMARSAPEESSPKPMVSAQSSDEALLVSAVSTEEATEAQDMPTEPFHSVTYFTAPSVDLEFIKQVQVKARGVMGPTLSQSLQSFELELPPLIRMHSADAAASTSKDKVTATEIAVNEVATDPIHEPAASGAEEVKLCEPEETEESDVQVKSQETSTPPAADVDADAATSKASEGHESDNQSEDNSASLCRLAEALLIQVTTDHSSQVALGRPAESPRMLIMARDAESNGSEIMVPHAVDEELVVSKGSNVLLEGGNLQDTEMSLGTHEEAETLPMEGTAAEAEASAPEIALPNAARRGSAPSEASGLLSSAESHDDEINSAKSEEAGTPPTEVVAAEAETSANAIMSPAAVGGDVASEATPREGHISTDDLSEVSLGRREGLLQVTTQEAETSGLAIALPDAVRRVSSLSEASARAGLLSTDESHGVDTPDEVMPQEVDTSAPPAIALPDAAIRRGSAHSEASAREGLLSTDRSHGIDALEEVSVTEVPPQEADTSAPAIALPDAAIRKGSAHSEVSAREDLLSTDKSHGVDAPEEVPVVEVTPQEAEASGPAIALPDAVRRGSAASEASAREDLLSADESSEVSLTRREGLAEVTSREADASAPAIASPDAVCEGAAPSAASSHERLLSADESHCVEDVPLLEITSREAETSDPASPDGDGRNSAPSEVSEDQNPSNQSQDAEFTAQQGETSAPAIALPDAVLSDDAQRYSDDESQDAEASSERPEEAFLLHDTPVEAEVGADAAASDHTATPRRSVLEPLASADGSYTAEISLSGADEGEVTSRDLAVSAPAIALPIMEPAADDSPMQVDDEITTEETKLSPRSPMMKSHNKQPPAFFPNNRCVMEVEEGDSDDDDDEDNENQLNETHAKSDNQAQEEAGSPRNTWHGTDALDSDCQFESSDGDILISDRTETPADYYGEVSVNAYSHAVSFVREGDEVILRSSNFGAPEILARGGSSSSSEDYSERHLSGDVASAHYESSASNEVSLDFEHCPCVEVDANGKARVTIPTELTPRAAAHLTSLTKVKLDLSAARKWKYHLLHVRHNEFELSTDCANTQMALAMVKKAFADVTPDAVTTTFY